MAEPPGDDVRQQLRQCAHDLNNVLGQVLGFSSLLVRDIGTAQAEGRIPAGLLDYAQELLAAGLRGEVVAKQLTAIVRSMPAGPAGDGPLTATPSAGDTVASHTTAAPARHLLLAGTEDAFGRPTLAAFTDAGWRVEAHRSGADALRRLRAGPIAFEVVIVHPSAVEIAGADLVAAVKALSPQTTCVLALGEGAVVDETAARLIGADGCLERSVSGFSAVAMVEGIVNRVRSAA